MIAIASFLYWGERVGISLRVFNAVLPHVCLKRVDIAAPHHKVCCKTVPQVVKGEPFQASRFKCLPEIPFHLYQGNGLVSMIDKDIIGSNVAGP